MSIGAIALVATLATAGIFTLVGLLHARRQKANLEDYMVSRNRVGTWMAFATIVASAMGAWILFSPPEVGATSGVAGILGYCMGQATPAAIFAVIGIRIRHLMPKGHSLNEYVFYRFGNAMYLLVLGIIVFYMFVYLAAELTAIAKAVEIMGNVPLGLTALVVMVAVFAYTSVGGLGTTIFTDAVQFVIIVPLLLLSFAVAVIALGGWGAAIAPVQDAAPQLLSLGNGPGLKFGLILVIAVISAEMFNQSNWQRIYACRNDGVVRRSFLASAVAIVPILLIAGLLGIVAMHFEFADDRAFFSLLQALAVPTWMIVGVLILALALVMSSIDTLLNGIASVFTLDLTRLFPTMQPSNLLRASRILTVVIGLPTIAIAAQGYNVLYLFLLADLVCAGALIPMLNGLYSRRLTGTVAFVSALLGIAAGALFFPKPDFSPWTPLPFAGDLLVAFVVPIVVSGVIVGLWNTITARIGSNNVFDFSNLNRRIQDYGENAVGETVGVGD
ncbi:MAG: Na+/proline symporter [Cyanobacteria bacterium J06659_2]